jgi:TonB family protein
MKKAVVVWTVLAGAWPAELCAQVSDLGTILERARKAHEKTDNYQLRALLSTETVSPEFEQTMKARVLVAAGSGGKFRVEHRGMGGFTKVSDGAGVWTYNAFLKQYTKGTAAETVSAAISMSPLAPLLPPAQGAQAKAGRLLGEEDVMLEGVARPCYVLEVDGSASRAPAPPGAEKGSSKFWIDKETSFVLKSAAGFRAKDLPPLGAPAEIRMTLTVEALTFDAPPAELFAFTPPEGSRLVDSFGFPGMNKPELVGKTAPDFTLRDLEGKEVRLASLRGKVVLLNFWTTWCAPCRAEIPLLKKVHEEEKDFALLGVNVGEDKSLVSDFVEENEVTYPVLLAGKERMVSEYSARAFPTSVVIDKDGVIRAYQTGYSPDAERRLLDAIREARSTAPEKVSVTESMPMPVHKVGDGVSAPEIIFKREPEYTEEARRARVSGAVLLEAIVSPEGVPLNATVMRGLGSGLDERAVEAVRSWRFRPGLKEGKPVAVKISVEVKFSLLTPPHVQQPMEEPRTAQEAYRRGARFVRERRQEDAVAMFAKASALDPKMAHAWAGRARVAFQENRYGESIKNLDEALRLQPGNAMWHDLRGLAYSHSGQHKRAIEDYNRAIELNPSAPAGFYNNRGWALNETGQPERAIGDLDRAIAMEPAYQTAYENRALAWFRLKEYGRAIADYTAAMDVRPTPWQYEKRAEARRAAGDAAGADEDMRKAAELREGRQSSAAHPSEAGDR